MGLTGSMCVYVHAHVHTRVNEAKDLNQQVSKETENIYVRKCSEMTNHQKDCENQMR